MFLIISLHSMLLSVHQKSYVYRAQMLSIAEMSISTSYALCLDFFMLNIAVNIFQSVIRYRRENKENTGCLF